MQERKVLIADDSSAMRSMLGGMLDALDYEYVEAADGEEALAVLNRHDDIGIALLDWHMPKRSGLEVIKAIRSNERWDDLAIAMVTSESTIDRVSEALEAGADEFLMKPFDREMLVAKLNVLEVERDDP